MPIDPTAGGHEGAAPAFGVFVAEVPLTQGEPPDLSSLPPFFAARPDLALMVQEAARADAPRSGRIRTGQGSTERILEMRIEPRRSGDGVLTGLLVAGADVTALTQAEETARRERAAREEIEAHHHLVAEHSCDWDYWLGPDGRLRWMSPSCETVTGYPPEAFHANPGLIIDIVHPDDRRRVRRELAEHLDAAKPLHTEFLIVTRSGEVRCIDHLCQPVTAADGSPAGRRTSNRDITERKAAEEQAEHHLGELEAIYANAPVGLAVLDADLRYLRINERLAAMNGRSVADHLGNRLEDVLPELGARFAPRLRQAIATGEAVVGEEIRGTSAALPGVERVWLVSWSPAQSAKGIVGVNLVVEEVTERRRVEKALRESEERFRAMAELVPDMLFTTDPAGGTDYANPRFYEHTGFAPGQAQGLGWTEALHPEDRERVARVWHDSVAAGQPATFRYRLRGRDGDYRWFQTRAYPLRDAAGSIVRWFGVASDIHPLIAAQETLEEADRRKDEFLAILGHELRNPMAPIRNAVEVIRMVGTNEPQLRWAAEVLDQQTAQMARLLDDLLDLPRITRGTLKLEQRPVEIVEVVQQSVDSIRPLLQERGHALTLDLPQGELWVRGDTARLLQVFVNLLSNAAKHMDNGGKIHLSVESDDVDVRVKVRDAGRGLAPEIAQRMFDPFARGTEDGARAAGGLGLGLTIARRLVDLHGGRIEAQSAGPGFGSTFAVHLPRLDPAATRSSRAPAEAATSGARGVSHRILVVDDNPVVARALGILLRLMGHEVEIAHSGEDALGAAHRFRPRIALLDIGMRGMDGFELARRLRAEVPRRADLLLVAVTGYGDPSVREQSRDAGFDHHLVKPVDRRTLMRLLAELDQDAANPPVG